ncbi:MAG: 5-formyltetrahydrofolate cyclo-ligase [Eubacteriales bacterium]
MDNKTELRQKCLALRNSFGEDFIMRASEKICRIIAQSAEFESADTVLLYYPIRNELSVCSLLQSAQKLGKKVGFPACDKANRTLTFREITNLCDLESGSYGIFEPGADMPEISATECTLCIVPGVAFSRKGERLGYGAGYYDRFLADFRGKSIGICASELLFDTLPNDEYDIPIDIIITESEVLHRAGTE